MGYDFLKSYWVRMFILFFEAFTTMKMFMKSSLLKASGLPMIESASLRAKWFILAYYCPYGVLILTCGSYLTLFLYFMNLMRLLMCVLVSSL